MHRLSDFRQHIVCDVDDIVYWTDTHCAQTGFDSLRGRENPYVSHSARHISGTKFGIEHLNGHHFFDAGACGNIIYFGFAAIDFESDRHFLCQFVNAVAVGTVRRHADVQNHVVIAQRFESVGTEFLSFGESDNVAALLSRHVVDGYAQFFQTAQHTFGFHSAERAFNDFGSVREHRSVQRDGNGFAALDGDVGDNLQNFAADVDGYNAQSVRVGMLCDLRDFSDDHFGNFLGLIYYLLDLKTDCHEFFCENFGRNVDVDIIFQPRYGC